MKQTMDLRTALKTLMLCEPGYTLSDLQAELRGIGFECSDLTVASIRSSFLEDMKLLEQEGVIIRKPVHRPDWLCYSQPERDGDLSVHRQPRRRHKADQYGFKRKKYYKQWEHNG